MNWPNRLTVFRIILSPLFFVAFFLPEWSTETGEAVNSISSIIVAVIFVVIEISDVLDGYLARKHGTVTDIGKVIDPFADVLSRMTYFFCFTLSGLMPAWIFLLLIYRELGATFLRMVMLRRGIAMAASVWGKAKAVTYALGGILGVGHIVISRSVPRFESLLEGLSTAALIVFVAAFISSYFSFGSYVVKAIPSLRE